MVEPEERHQLGHALRDVAVVEDDCADRGIEGLPSQRADEVFYNEGNGDVYFVQELRDPATALETLGLYPVLARYAVEAVESWLEVSREFLTHLVEDREALRALFAPDAGLGRLVELDGGLGDSHRGGRSVLKAVFDSGLTLVYNTPSLIMNLPVAFEIKDIELP